MILTREEYTEMEEFIQEHTGTALAKNAGKALRHYGGYDRIIDDYVVIKVGSYYAVTKIIDFWQPIEVKEEVQPFDEERIYPLQRVQKKIEWVY